MVVEQQTGNNGFLLGHEDSFAFHSGAGTAWSDTWTDAYVLNGILQVNGNLLDGLQQNLGYDQPLIVAIQTTGMLRASNFSKDRNNAIHWKGDLAELIIYNEALPVSTRQVEGYLAYKWGITGSLVGTHPFKSLPPGTKQARRIDKDLLGWSRR